MLYKSWIPSSLSSHLAFKPCFFFARLFQLIPAIFACHIICLAICLSTVLIFSLLNCIQVLRNCVQNIRHARKGADILLAHNCIAVVLLMCNDLVGLAVLAIMGLLFIVSVLYNFISLKLYHIIPMPLYLYFPFVAVLVPCFLSLILPMAINVYEFDTEIQRKWKYYSHHSTRVRLLSRQIRATKVLRISGGILNMTLYELKKNVKPRYFYEMVYYTITVLVSIKVDKVCRIGFCKGK